MNNVGIIFSHLIDPLYSYFKMTDFPIFYHIKFQVTLHITDTALRLIARKAMAKNTGARGLRSILENILTEAMYEVCCQ